MAYGCGRPVCVRACVRGSHMISLVIQEYIIVIIIIDVVVVVVVVVSSQSVKVIINK